MFLTFPSPGIESHDLAKAATNAFQKQVFPFLNFESKAALSLVTEVNTSKQKPGSSLHDLLDVLKTFYQADKTTKLRLPKPENDIGYTKSQNKVRPHCIKQITELLNTQMRLSHQFQNIQTCIFPLEKFVLQIDQFKLTENSYIFHRKKYHSSSICWQKFVGLFIFQFKMKLSWETGTRRRSKGSSRMSFLSQNGSLWSECHNCDI